MYSVLLTTIVSFLFCLVLTPLVRYAFLRWDIVDRPDGVRKLHARAVPRAGGVPIALSYLSAYLVLLISPLREGATLVMHCHWSGACSPRPELPSQPVWLMTSRA